MTTRTGAVPVELLEELIEQHITAKGFTNETARKAQAILSAPVVDEPAPNLNTGHGYVRPRPDGVRMRCGGPSICQVCILEARTLADFGPYA